MTEISGTASVAPTAWGKLDVRPENPEVAARCTPDYLQKALKHLGDLRVVGATVNTSGRHDVPPPIVESILPFPLLSVIEDLPPFCDVTIDARGPSGHNSTITVWAPLHWNGRFLGAGGGGNRTEGPLGMPEIGRSLNLPTALRHGFATAKTDGGNKDRRLVEWGFKEETDEIDWALTQNWVHHSTHEMTVIAKAVVEALYGEAPKYSYFAGCSGGGRQALMEAQRYPDDYDGLWAADPAINWTKMIPAEMWPALVMKELGVLPPAKLNVFRQAAIEACDGLDGLRDGVVGVFDPCDFDPRRVVGQVTDAGPLTEADAAIMAKILEGPRTRNGEFLWYGIHPATDSWGSDAMPLGLCASQIQDGKRELIPFTIAEGYLRVWVAKDPAWDWRRMTFEEFERLFERSVRERSDLAPDEPDLSSFRDRGGKVIISHGANDPLIFPQGTLEYYRRVIDAIGSEEATKRFARLFLTEGDVHGGAFGPGPGLNVPEAMSALIKWVEEGVPPDEINAKSIDLFTGATKAERPAYAYPCVPKYRGAGDPNAASSFAPVHMSERATK